jgi:hypothetical protein
MTLTLTLTNGNRFRVNLIGIKEEKEELQKIKFMSSSSSPSTLPKDSLWFVPYLFGIYGSIGIAFTLLLSSERSKSSGSSSSSSNKIRDGLLILLTLHLGFILAISFMEAIVKFNAPFLPKYIGLDVGRHVFQALNAVELALVGTMIAILFFNVPYFNDSISWAWTCPIFLTLAVLVQTFYLTPKLELRGKHIIMKEIETNGGYDSLKKSGVGNESANLEAVYKAFKAQTTLVKSPSKGFHAFYVILELAKVCLIIFTLYRFLFDDLSQ